MKKSKAKFEASDNLSNNLFMLLSKDLTKLTLKETHAYVNKLKIDLDFNIFIDRKVIIDTLYYDDINYKIIVIFKEYNFLKNKIVKYETELTINKSHKFIIEKLNNAKVNDKIKISFNINNIEYINNILKIKINLISIN